MTGKNKEEMARMARYRILFDIMKEKGAGVLLMAHHLDDQVETAIMRHRRSKFDKNRAPNTAIGLAGMRNCRRWGMGKSPDNGIWYYGLEGMSRWLCRPLLEFPKV
jgi:tRNA(Ile)-lysidine synthase